jgi:carbon-monoxide dehydrogenase small subunit
MKREITFQLNGTTYTKAVDTNIRLLDFLREDMLLTGTKEGCGVGECGACTIIVNGLAVNSCLMLAVQIDGATVKTVEGLSLDGVLHPLQDSFVKHGAVQCGFCTPGMLLSADALLSKNANPTEEEIATALEGNLCRCTGYKQIIEAVKDAGVNYR